MTDQAVIQRALKRFSSCELAEDIPDTLPLVDELCNCRVTDDIFADMDVVFIQHHLGPFIPRLRATLNRGLEPSRCWFVDIPYSTNESVRKALLGLGFSDKHISDPFNDPIAQYSRNQLDRVARVLRILANQDNKKRLLVVDDGAYFIRTLIYLLATDAGLVRSFRERGTYLVEQTTRGHRYLETEMGKDLLRTLNIPAVSVARSHTKYSLESRFIGVAVSRGFIRALRQSGRLTKGLGRVLVIGFGPVGKSTTEQLSRLEHEGLIEVYDKEWKILQGEIQRDGKAIALQSFPDKGYYDSIFGCTGYTSFPVEKVGILSNDAVLVSGSSAAIEFNREQFVDLACESESDDFFVIEPEKTRSRGIHATIKMQKGNKKFSFLNAGFPANFDGSLECLPALIIQITHGLLLAASQEALHSSPGFHRLNRYDDDWLHQRGMYWIKQYALAA